MIRIIKGILFKAYKILFFCAGVILPKNERIIMFESFLGKQYSDNPRAIYESLKKYDQSYKMYWSFDRHSIKEFNHLDIQSVRRFSLRWLILMTRAKYWITNSRLPAWIPKPRKTIYVQTWHGTPLKRLAADMDEVHMPGTNTKQYKRNFLNEVKKWDYLISPNAYSTKIFKRAFQFDKHIIESGYPRNDALVRLNSEGYQLELKAELGLPLNKKVILYAPTWRDDDYYTVGKYKFELKMDIERLRKELGSNYIIILRLHYLIAENIDLTGYTEFLYDFSQYEDIKNLYLVSDMLITDYSSVFFDYAILKRPMLFYVYDIEQY